MCPDGLLRAPGYPRHQPLSRPSLHDPPALDPGRRKKVQTQHASAAYIIQSLSLRVRLFPSLFVSVRLCSMMISLLRVFRLSPLPTSV
ncbi:hypothetical protein VTO73DRAFT_6314 [Trametes versicolor]